MSESLMQKYYRLNKEIKDLAERKCQLEKSLEFVRKTYKEKQEEFDKVMEQIFSY